MASRSTAAHAAAARDVALPAAFLETVACNIDDAVLATDDRALVTWLNPAAERLTGWTSNEAWGHPMEDVLSLERESEAAPARAWRDWLAALAEDQAPQGAAATLKRRDGLRLPVVGRAYPVRAADGGLQGSVFVLRAFAGLGGSPGSAAPRSGLDPITGLINRQDFEGLLAECRDASIASSAGHALVYLDLDQFKVVNDTCGHAAGDQLLKQVAGILTANIRHSDALARLGGDEFGLLLRNCPVAAAVRVAENLRRALAESHFTWSDRSFALAASIGLVHFESSSDPAQVLSAADAACYLAKDKGRNRIHVHDQADAETMQRRGELDWASRIDGALAHDRFVLYAQRIAPLDERAGNGHYELLVRMRDEQGGLVPPIAFLPAAERYGLMPAIDRWVVRQAFATLAAARADGALHLRFSINLSAASLSDDTFLPFLLDQFDVHALPHARICFEVTETAAIANLASAMKMIDALRDLGCKFSLDDFGCGMSSFAYLKKLRIDYLKIDGTFVRDIASNGIDAAMVEAIHRVARVMGLETVAEFVEDDAAIERLRAIGVDYAQGYGIHVPQPLALVLGAYGKASRTGGSPPA